MQQHSDVFCVLVLIEMYLMIALNKYTYHKLLPINVSTILKQIKNLQIHPKHQT